MHSFTADLKIIGVNPYVSVPDDVLQALFAAAGRSRGTIAIHGTVNGRAYRQTLVKFAGEWRLYVNTKMLKDSPRHVGERLEVTVDFDASSRAIAMPPRFAEALAADPEATAVFERLAPSRRLEIVRYLANLKRDDVLQKNIARALNFLHGRGRFAGRDRP